MFLVNFVSTLTRDSVDSSERSISQEVAVELEQRFVAA